MRRTNILACLLLAAASCLPFQPWLDSRPSGCALELRVTSDESGLMRLYYDVGRGFVDADASVQPVLAGGTATVRFALPHGTFRAFRLDPLDRDARMTLAGARVIGRGGRILATFSASQFHPNYQIDFMEAKGDSLVMRTSPDARYPRLTLDPAAPIVIPNRFWALGPLLVFVCSLALLLLLDVAIGSPKLLLAERFGRTWVRAQGAPGSAIMIVALAATLLANYPVIFAGKSFVSPNLGSALLYGKNPYVPGFQSTEEGNAQGADIDPVLWHHLPLSMLEHRSFLHDHELPLWNRYDSAGTPLLGQGQSCMGDPLHLIPFLANGASWAWDLKYLAAKWLLACATGLCVWRLGRHLPSALLLAASVEFIGFFVYRINHPAIFSLCYSPWILYFWLRILDSRTARSALLWLGALVGANLCVMNSGTVKEAYLLLGFLNLAGFCMLVAQARPASEKRWLFGVTSLGAGVFILIGSPVWLTFYRALQGSFTTYNAPQAFQIQPGMALGLFDEAFYRPFQTNGTVINPSVNFLILVGLLWCVVGWRSVFADRRAIGLAVAALPPLLLVFGVIPPAWIVRVPFLGNILHIDNTFSCILVILFSVLAGLGWRRAWERLGTREGRHEATRVMVLLVALVLIYLGTAQAIVRSAYWQQSWGRTVSIPGFIQGYALSLIAGAALLMGVLHQARERRFLTPALAICGLVALGALHWREGLQLGTAFPDYAVVPTGRVNLQARSPALDAIIADGKTPFRSIGFLDNFFPGWSIVYRLEGINGPDALVNPYYRQLMDASGIEKVWDWRYMLREKDLKGARPILDLLNVRYYLDYPAGDRAPAAELTPVLSADMEVFESPTYWPRAFFTDGVFLYDDAAQFCARVREGDGRPLAALERSEWESLSPAPPISKSLGGRSVEPGSHFTLSGNTTSFTVKATGPGIIVLTEAYERGNFQVTLNGQDVPYLRVNHAFKGIFVDTAGTYTVRYRYWPRELTAALWLSGAGVLLALLGILVALRWGPLGQPFAAAA